MNKGTLFLIPTTLGESALDSLSLQITETVCALSEFIVEDEKTARRFLKKINPEIRFDFIILHSLNEHTKPEEYSDYLSSALNGESIGLLSEAGVPCVADPGAVMVTLAHRKGIRVRPLSGPSSIFLALMGSGFNGQSFTFHGYLPVEKDARTRKIIELEKTARATGYTQIFIETPYRNNQLLHELISRCANDTVLCVAIDLTCESETIISQSIHEWKKGVHDFNKRPSVFLIGTKSI
jgi:16S rRNA (cytidine1402-2'-O)-methyltransferase